MRLQGGLSCVVLTVLVSLYAAYFAAVIMAGGVDVSLCVCSVLIRCVGYVVLGGIFLLTAQELFSVSSCIGSVLSLFWAVVMLAR